MGKNSVKGMEERLCERAREKLRAAIDVAFAPAIAMIGHRHFLLKSEDGKPQFLAARGAAIPASDAGYGSLEAIRNLKDAMFAEMVDRAEQEEIDGFLREVNELGTRVDELRQGVGQ